MILGAALFAIGAVGFIFRRNIIVMFMSAELMLNAVNLNFIAFSAEWANSTGETFAVFVIAIAAAEAAIGLARHERMIGPLEGGDDFDDGERD